MKNATLISLLALAAALLPAACSQKHPAAPGADFPDTIRAATIFGPASFFSYRDTLMGYDYDFLEKIAADHHRAVAWTVANSLDEALATLNAGEADLIAAPIPEEDFSTVYKDKLIPCGPVSEVDQVLVQPPGDTLLLNVRQLAGKTVCVEKGSKAQKALKKLSKSLPAPIRIEEIDTDTLALEDLLAQASRGERGPVAVDRETARLNKSYHPGLNITLSLSEPEKSRWGAPASKPWVAERIDEWCKGAKPEKCRADIVEKYLDSQKNTPVAGASFDRQFENGYASPFDHLYKRHTEGTRWDWRLIAAQGYTESRFDSTARSWAGAQGVMQIMPGTARAFGLAKSEMNSADRSIETAVKILDKYDKMMEAKVPDEAERRKFSLAAYNAGPGHVLDAIKLAEKYGLDPTKWDDNVEKAMLMKMNKKYYRDPVVKYGYSRGRETVDYVDRIFQYYDQARARIPKESLFKSA